MRDERTPLLVEAITYRFRGHSMADPEEYRDKEQVEEWRKKDPIPVVRRAQLELSTRTRPKKLDEAAVSAHRRGRAFADIAVPAAESLYDHIYVLGDQVKGWYSVDERCGRACTAASDERRAGHARERRRGVS